VGSEVDGWVQVEWRSGAAGGGSRVADEEAELLGFVFASGTPVFIIRRYNQVFFFSLPFLFTRVGMCPVTIKI
jgi:hypothetical protein